MKKLLYCLTLTLTTLSLLCGCTPKSEEASTKPEQEATEELPVKDDTITILACDKMASALNTVKDNYTILEPDVKIEILAFPAAELSQHIEEAKCDILITDDSNITQPLKDANSVTSDVPYVKDPLVLIENASARTQVSEFENVVNCAHVAIAKPGTKLGDATHKVFENIGNLSYVNEVALFGETSDEVIQKTLSTPDTVGVIFGSTAANTDGIIKIATENDYIMPEPTISSIFTLENATEGTDSLVNYLQTLECIKLFENAGYEQYIPKKEA